MSSPAEHCPSRTDEAGEDDLKKPRPVAGMKHEALVTVLLYTPLSCAFCYFYVLNTCTPQVRGASWYLEIIMKAVNNFSVEREISPQIKCVKEPIVFSTLLLRDPTCGSPSSSGASSIKGMWTYWRKSKEGTWRWSEGWNTASVEIGWEG